MTDDHYTAIGRVAAYWSGVEHCAQAVIWDMLGQSSNVGRHQTAALRFDTILSIIDVLCAAGKAKSFKERLAGLVARTKTLHGKRNDVVHAIWASGKDDSAPIAIKLKMKDIDKQGMPYTVAQIDAIYRDVAHLRDDLMWFLIDFRMEQRRP